MGSDRFQDALTVGVLVLACKAWYDVMVYLHTRERVRACTHLVDRGMELLHTALDGNANVSRTGRSQRTRPPHAGT
jgi:hypothetical protein